MTWLIDLLVLVGILMALVVASILGVGLVAFVWNWSHREERDGEV